MIMIRFHLYSDRHPAVETLRLLPQGDKIRRFYSQNKGSILLLTILVLSVLTVLASYFMSFTITGSHMAKSYELSAKSYYLAESGLAEAIYKLKNDPIWKNAFETLPTEQDPLCSVWAISPLERPSAFGPGAGYNVVINNLGCAQAEIISTGEIILGDSVGRKVVKIEVYKAMASPLIQYGLFTGGSSENIEINSVNPLRIHNGSLFSNNLLKVKGASSVFVDNKALAAGNILVDWGSSLSATTCSANLCEAGCASDECPPGNVSVPGLDFNSTSATSYYSRAVQSDCSSARMDGKINCVFTPAEFEKMLWDNYPELSLPSGQVVYVTGDANIQAGQDLIINGVLAANRDINLGANLCWSRPEFPFVRCGNTRVALSRPSGGLSGLLAQRKINTGMWLGFGGAALNVEGLIYAGDEAKFASVGATITVRGAVVARKVIFSSLWNNVDIYLEPDIVAAAFLGSEYSPIATIDHWEERY